MGEVHSCAGGDFEVLEKNHDNWKNILNMLLLTVLSQGNYKFRFYWNLIHVQNFHIYVRPFFVSIS